MGYLTKTATPTDEAELIALQNEQNALNADIASYRRKRATKTCKPIVQFRSFKDPKKKPSRVMWIHRKTKKRKSKLAKQNYRRVSFEDREKFDKEELRRLEMQEQNAMNIFHEMEEHQKLQAGQMRLERAAEESGIDMVTRRSKKHNKLKKIKRKSGKKKLTKQRHNRFFSNGDIDEARDDWYKLNQKREALKAIVGKRNIRDATIEAGIDTIYRRKPKKSKIVWLKNKKERKSRLAKQKYRHDGFEFEPEYPLPKKYGRMTLRGKNEQPINVPWNYDVNADPEKQSRDDYQLMRHTDPQVYEGAYRRKPKRKIIWFRNKKQRKKSRLAKLKHTYREQGNDFYDEYSGGHAMKNFVKGDPEGYSVPTWKQRVDLTNDWVRQPQQRSKEEYNSDILASQGVDTVYRRKHSKKKSKKKRSKKLAKVKHGRTWTINPHSDGRTDLHEEGQPMITMPGAPLGNERDNYTLRRYTNPQVYEGAYRRKRSKKKPKKKPTKKRGK